LQFLCRSSVLSPFSLLSFQFQSVYWPSCECFLGRVSARAISYEHDWWMFALTRRADSSAVPAWKSIQKLSLWLWC
jgi:hypothetical protein